MSNRWLRFVIAVLAIAAAGAAGFRIFQQEQRLTGNLGATRSAEQAAESAIVTISELKAALHAYVAEGQGPAFWTARAATLIDRLRSSILELDKSAAPAGAPLTETLDLTDRLAATEQRAREHVRDGQRLLAGEVIFNETRDLLEAMRLQIVRARTTISHRAASTSAGLRREQAMLAIGAGGILAFAALLLVIPGSGPASGPQPLTPRRGSHDDDELGSSARVLSRAPVAKPEAASSRAPAPSSGESGPVARTGPSASAPSTAPPVASAASAARPAPPRSTAALPSARSAPSVSLRDAAAVCTELGRVSQTVELTALLDRAAKVLSASGVVVWMASPDRHELYAAAAAGYDERLLSRIGAIKRDAHNVTAAALREGTARTSAKVGTSAAALAVPLLTPLGPVGVFSAEIKDVAAVDETRLAVATIFAAQLASLLGSMSAPAADDVNSASPAAKAQA